MKGMAFDKIKKLREHANNNVYEKAVFLTESYFWVDDEEDEVGATGVITVHVPEPNTPNQTVSSTNANKKDAIDFPSALTT